MEENIWIVWFLTEEAYIHGELQTRKLGQTPLSINHPQSEIEFSTDSTKTDPG